MTGRIARGSVALASAALLARHFANTNDFLATPADLTWLAETLVTEHVTIYPTGGHLGNLYKPEVQAEIMASIADLSRDSGPPP